MISVTDVFVSYKVEDRARLAPLIAALEAEGFNVWWDARIGGGTNWHEDIEQHLEMAKCVVVAWSKRSIGHDGHFVRDEARRAQRRGVYVPVILDSVEPPLGFGEVQAISLKGWHGDRSDSRFLMLVDAIRECITGVHAEHARTHLATARISRRTVVAGGAGIGAIAAAGAGGWLLLKPAPANAKRIAVMDFNNLSGDPSQAYFSDGIAEELRSTLSRVGMQVIGRDSSEAARNLDTKTAAAKLNVANILTGSVRRSPETIRIDAQLVSGKDGVEKWAQTYDRAPGDTIKIQTDIAENVADALSAALGQVSRVALTLGGTADSVAQDLILQSRQLGRQAGGAEIERRRVALADAAIARDRRYADAYVEKSYALLGLAINFTPTPAEVADLLGQANVVARKAVAIAPRLGSAYSALARAAEGTLDFVGCLRDTRQSVALSPNDPDVLAFGSRSLAWFGSGDEGVQMADRGVALDPLNARSYRAKSEVLVLLRRYPDAIEAGRKALQLAPDHPNAHIFVGDALLLLGHSDKAKAEYEMLGHVDPFRLLRLAVLAARTGNRSEALQLMAQARQHWGATASFQYGEINAQLGDSDGAFVEFENAIKAKDSGLSYLKFDPFLDPIRNDPRYAALLRSLNFP